MTMMNDKQKKKRITSMKEKGLKEKSYELKVKKEKN